MSAGLACLPGIKALSSLVGPRQACTQVENKQSLMASCLYVRSPPHPHDMAWSPNVSETAGHATHIPSLGNICKPNLYFTHTTNSAALRWRPKEGEGRTFNHAPEFGRPRELTLALSLTLPFSLVFVRNFWTLFLSTLVLVRASYKWYDGFVI